MIYHSGEGHSISLCPIFPFQFFYFFSWIYLNSIKNSSTTQFFPPSFPIYTPFPFCHPSFLLILLPPISSYWVCGSAVIHARRFTWSLTATWPLVFKTAKKLILLNVWQALSTLPFSISIYLPTFPTTVILYFHLCPYSGNLATLGQSGWKLHTAILCLCFALPKSPTELQILAVCTVQVQMTSETQYCTCHLNIEKGNFWYVETY